MSTAGVERLVRDALPDLEVVDVRRTRSRYSTSAPLDELDVVAADGTVVKLMVKELAWTAQLPEARASKPQFLHDPRREVALYRSVLPHAPAGPPRLVAADLDERGGRPVLVLERVQGRELYQVGALGDWERAARWLAALHASPPVHRAVASLTVPLVRWDRKVLQRWVTRACSFVADPRMRRVADRFPAVVERLLALPRTLVHGQAYASNVLVSPDRVSVVDWETAALAPGLVDLAALVAGGGWTDAERARLVEAYLGRPAGEDDLRDLAACRLQLAVQWLGWSPAWQPPDEHAQDWLAEALALTEQLDG